MIEELLTIKNIDVYFVMGIILFFGLIESITGFLKNSNRKKNTLIKGFISLQCHSSRSISVAYFLKSNQKDLILRMKNDKTRPLLQNGNIEEIIKKLCKEREPLYEEIADFEITTKNKKIHEVVNEIMSVIN